MTNKHMKLILDMGRIYPTENSKQKYHYAIYECPLCTKHFRIRIDHTETRSCRECHMGSKVTHNESKTKLFKVWTAMKQRCNDHKNKKFNIYGGRGISLCKEWENSYEEFRNWALSNGYKENLSIDRIDNDGNYEPSNCRWATNEVQAQNTRKIWATNTSGYRGVSFNKTKGKFVAQITANRKHFNIGTFDTAIEAGKAYDSFVKKHKLNHTVNAIREVEVAI